MTFACSGIEVLHLTAAGPRTAKHMVILYSPILAEWKSKENKHIKAI